MARTRRQQRRRRDRKRLEKYGSHEFLKKLSPAGLYPKQAVDNCQCWWCGREFNYFKQLSSNAERAVFLQTGICKNCNSEIYEGV